MPCPAPLQARQQVEALQVARSSEASVWDQLSEAQSHTREMDARVEEAEQRLAEVGLVCLSVCLSVCFHDLLPVYG